MNRRGKGFVGTGALDLTRTICSAWRGSSVRDDRSSRPQHKWRATPRTSGKGQPQRVATRSSRARNMRPCASDSRRQTRALDNLDPAAPLDPKHLIGDGAHVRAVDNVRERRTRTIRPGEARYPGTVQRHLDDPAARPGARLDDPHAVPTAGRVPPRTGRHAADLGTVDGHGGERRGETKKTAPNVRKPAPAKFLSMPRLCEPRIPARGRRSALTSRQRNRLA